MVHRGLLLLVVGLALAGAARAADTDPTVPLEGVLDLTPENFDQHVNGKKHALVEFYAPWCGHCKRLTPEYRKLAAAVKASPTLRDRVVVAKVDADRHRSLGERFGVQGFPTIKHFGRRTQGEPGRYEGARTAEAFVSYLEAALAEDTTWARVPELDEIARSFSSGATEAAEAAARAASASEGLAEDQAENAKLYVRYLTKAAEKGGEYIASESARLAKLAAGKVSQAKLAELDRKLSVLSAFLPEAA